MEPICTQVKVRVPATSANLGSGFDTVGLALDYHDELTFTLSRDPSNRAAQVLIYGEGEDTLPRDETHLVVSTFRKACQTFGLGKVGFILEAHNNIPQARGMGSSAEAIVAGIAAAAALEVDGVSGLAANLGSDIAELLGKKNLAKGVRVKTEEDKVEVELSVLIVYGHTIPQVGKAIQDGVKAAIESMTGLEVSSVNVNVGGIVFPPKDA